MNCSSCGGPLPAKSNICTYCNSLNDTDLRAMARRGGVGEESDRNCPCCSRVKLEQLRLGRTRAVTVDRCRECFGLFFDHGEPDQVIDSIVNQPNWIDLDRLNAIVNQETPTGDFRDFKYRNCPECGEMMARKAYAARSGVISDQCRKHGVWLDGGELHRLLKWAAAGGRAQDQKAKSDQADELKRSRERLDSLLESVGAIGKRWDR